ncbi:hypothetical protein DDB_G0277981 [Dictyostelium discoideum AX4]|uniref:Uncharacterized protein n=1 Tax=Dictyostelium discoideum TaxID=44689 RepID=Q54Z06_DICDI|nr:hypothetical protein DDB_G0277981 [Dictyostelium discoideum AX4]EAL68163.1 hypothetical protein DDB_G0277981 [Dictyostelium discoideum AX4]|eukprot:XP_642046.1 hypothetical protein DDB_G0277981 [Dictyostelium discoideum AX4]
MEPISYELMEDDSDDIISNGQKMVDIFAATVSDYRKCMVWTFSPFQSLNPPEIWTSDV